MFGRCLRKKRKYSDELPLSVLQSAQTTFHKNKPNSYLFHLSRTINFIVQHIYGIMSLSQLCFRNPIPELTPQFKQEDEYSEFFSITKQYTLVLDLDETLIHANPKRSSTLDKQIIVQVGDHQEVYYVKKRPYLDHFLNKMSKTFELVIFTASLQQYADQIIDYIDPQGLIKQRYYRQVSYNQLIQVCQDCIKQNCIYYKDLKRIGQNLENILIVDNSKSGFQLNLGKDLYNGLLIKSWYNDLYDRELLDYGSFLENGFKDLKIDAREIIKVLKKNFSENILNY